MTGLGLLFFAGGAALTAVVFAITGLILRERAASEAARWYARVLLGLATVLGVAAGAIVIAVGLGAWPSR